MTITPNQLLKARRKLCLQMMESLELEFKLDKRVTEWDLDQAVEFICAIMPSTYAELETEMDEAEEKDKQPQGRSIIAPLYEALGYTAENRPDLQSLLAAATERIQKCKCK